MAGSRSSAHLQLAPELSAGECHKIDVARRNRAGQAARKTSGSARASSTKQSSSSVCFSEGSGNFRGFGTCIGRIGGDRRRAAPVRRLDPLDFERRPRALYSRVVNFALLASELLDLNARATFSANFCAADSQIPASVHVFSATSSCLNTVSCRQ